MSNKKLEFQTWWDTEGEWVEEPNQRRGGMSGVQRVVQEGKTYYVKRMTHHLFRSVLHPIGVPTIVREIHRLKKLASLGIPVPHIVFGEAMKINGEWHALLVTEEMKGFMSLPEWYATEADKFSDDQKKEILKQLAISLKKMHNAHYQHGSCNTKHIFIKTEDKIEVGFLDLEKSRFRSVKKKAMDTDFRFIEKTVGKYFPEEDWKFAKDYYLQLDKKKSL